MKTRACSIWAVAIALTSAACTVNQTTVPELTAPSDFARSLFVTATPDNLYYNGQQAVIIVEAHDGTGAPLANQRVHLSIVAGGFIADDCGHLSLSDVTTGSDGRTATVFTAPSLPLPLPECEDLSNGTITISATPVGSNFQTARFFSATIRLRTPPTGPSSSATFSVNFLITPNAAPRDFTFADAGSVSPGHTITGYRWNWSDGATKTGSSVTHDFPSAGTYTATLTITDDLGQSGSKSALLTIN